MALAARVRACAAASPSRRAAAKLRASVASSQARGEGCGVAPISQDKDVKAAFAEWKKPCPLMRQRSELKATMSEFTVDQGRAEDLISRYLTAALNDSLEDEEALDLGIDAAASLERAVASGLEDDEPDTGLYGASLTRLTGLAGILDTYVEAPAAEAEDQPRTSELGPASTQTPLATVFFLADAQATVSRLYNGGDRVSTPATMKTCWSGADVLRYPGRRRDRGPKRGRGLRVPGRRQV
jgi:hypothetical protein